MQRIDPEYLYGQQAIPGFVEFKITEEMKGQDAARAPNPIVAQVNNRGWS